MKRNTLLLGLFILALSVGCADKGVPVVRVTGQVLFEGQPLDEASVTFSPTTLEGREASGRTNANGEFLLLTQGAVRSGCVPGSYRVTVTKSVPVDSRGNPIVFTFTDEFDPKAPPPPGMESGVPVFKSIVPDRYGSGETSELTADVTKRGRNVFVFELVK